MFRSTSSNAARGTCVIAVVASELSHDRPARRPRPGRCTRFSSPAKTATDYTDRSGYLHDRRRCAHGAMGIQEKRAEILRLIKTANRGSAVAERRPSSKPKAPRPAPSKRLAQRNEQLAAFRERRAGIETSRSDRVLEAVERLEQRIDQLEGALLAPSTSLPRPAEVETTESAMDFALGGTLRDGLLCDLIQLVSSNAMSGVFSVKDYDVEIRLYFDEGEICHAVGPGVEGEAAVFALVARERGTYRFRETTHLPDERSIHSKTQFLILEALRRIDEARAD